MNKYDLEKKRVLSNTEDSYHLISKSTNIIGKKYYIVILFLNYCEQYII